MQQIKFICKLNMKFMLETNRNAMQEAKSFP